MAGCSYQPGGVGLRTDRVRVAVISMRKRVIAWAVSVLVVVAGLGLSGSSASRAMSPGVHFTSTDSPTWQTDGTVWALGQSNGLVVVGGTFTTVRPPDGTSGSPIAANGLAVLDAETGLRRHVDTPSR